VKKYSDIPVMMSDIAAMGWQLTEIIRYNKGWICRVDPVLGSSYPVAVKRIEGIEGYGDSILQAIEECWIIICQE